jgi:hypothetical protein
MNESSISFDTMSEIGQATPWIPANAAVGMQWSALSSWLFWARVKPSMKDAERLDRATAAMETAASLFVSMEHMIPKKKRMDLTATIVQLLSSDRRDRLMSNDEHLKAVAEALGEPLDKVKEEAKLRVNNEMALEEAEVRRLDALKADQFASAFAHEVECADSRELSLEELIKFSDKLYVQYAGRPSQNGQKAKAGWIERTRDQLFNTTSPIIRDDLAAQLRLMDDDLKRLYGLQHILVREKNELERAGYDVEEGGVH